MSVTTRPTTLSKPLPGLYADRHPVDIISHAQNKIELFNTLLLQDNGTSALEHPALQDGIYWLLEGIARELEYAVSRLTNEGGANVK